MSELSWSDEELINTAEIIVDNEFKSLSRELNEYYGHRAEAGIIGTFSVAMGIGAIGLSNYETEGWLEVPQFIGTIGLGGLGIITAATALQSAYKAQRSQKRLIE